MDQRETWDSFYKSNRRPWKGVTSSKVPFPDGGHILEIGCGNGKTAAMLISEGFKVTGVDFSEAAVEMCRETLGEKGTFECADAIDLPFDDDSFDGALMFHVLEHLDDGERKKAISEIRRVLKPDAHLLVKTFSPDDMRSGKGKKIDDSTEVRGNGIIYRYYSEDDLRSMFGDMMICSIETKNEKTRFGETRSRIECDIVNH